MAGNEDDKIPLFNGDGYDNWRDAMKFQLKSKGAHVWDAVASKKWYLKNKIRISKDDQNSILSLCKPLKEPYQMMSR